MKNATKQALLKVGQVLVAIGTACSPVTLLAKIASPLAVILNLFKSKGKK